MTKKPRSKKKLTLLERLNESMSVVSYPPGCLVTYRKTSAESPFFEKKPPPKVFEHFGPYFTRIYDIDPGDLLLYLGIVQLGPRLQENSNAKSLVCSDVIFAHHFYYGDKVVYVMINRPDLHYTVFRRNFDRVVSDP